MTTQAGKTGLLTGLIISATIYLFFAGDPIDFMAGRGYFPICLVLTIMLLAAGGYLAAQWAGAVTPQRGLALGALSGGLAGSVVYSLWGAAAAGSACWFTTTTISYSQTDLISLVIQQTAGMFTVLFLGGTLAGLTGGWLKTFHIKNRVEVFNMAEPQMAMNASITALPASVVAVTVAAAVFPRLAANGIDRATLDLPLEVCLLLMLVSHLAVTIIVPHECRMSEHLCGMDEVKMAAFVGIGAAPVMTLLLLVADKSGFENPVVLMALLTGHVMSLISLGTLIRQVLPKRASFPPHEAGRMKTQAVLFGSIAESIASRLVVLCIGCGLMMVLPLYVGVLSILVNLRNLPAKTISWNLFVNQMATSVVTSAVSIGALILLYLFYLNLGRWFNRRQLSQENDR